VARVSARNWSSEYVVSVGMRASFRGCPGS
jgi:hypothetical protein